MRKYDYIVLGAGPAGLQLGWYLKRRGCNFVILEQGASAGTFFSVFPRHRRLISLNKVVTGVADDTVNLRWDWNTLISDAPELKMRKYSDKYFPHADDFVRYLADYATKLELPVTYNTRIENISRRNEFILVDSSGQAYQCRRLIVATGLSRQKSIDVAGSEYIESYSTVSINPESFRGQRVLVIGKGNAAFETAENIVETTAAIHMLSPSPVRLAWKTHYVGDLRATNNNVLDTYQLKMQNTIIDAEILSITKEGGSFRVDFRYTHANGEARSVFVDRIISCTGFEFDVSPFDDSCGPALAINGKYPELTAAWESTNVKDMYFAGALMHVRDYRKAFSGFIHGFRYNMRPLAEVLMCRYHDGKWPVRNVKIGPREVLDLIMERVHATSALFQQTGFIADVIAITNGKGELIEEVPIDLLPEIGVHGSLLILLTMEYGHQDHPDPFNIEREPTDGSKSFFIHPVIRVVSGDTLLAEYHVPEDLENEWRKPVFCEPLLDFLSTTLTRAALEDSIA